MHLKLLCLLPFLSLAVVAPARADDSPPADPRVPAAVALFRQLCDPAQLSFDSAVAAAEARHFSMNMESTSRFRSGSTMRTKEWSVGTADAPYTFHVQEQNNPGMQSVTCDVSLEGADIEAVRTEVVTALKLTDAPHENSMGGNMKSYFWPMSFSGPPFGRQVMVNINALPFMGRQRVSVSLSVRTRGVP